MMIKCRSRHSRLTKSIAAGMMCLFLVNANFQGITYAEMQIPSISTLAVNLYDDDITTKVDDDRLRGAIAEHVSRLFTSEEYQNDPDARLKALKQWADGVADIESVEADGEDYVFVLSAKYGGERLRQRPPMFRTIPEEESQQPQPTQLAKTNQDEISKKFVVAFDEDEFADINHIGGKGVGLVELSRLQGIKVPKGFIVSTSAYDAFLNINDDVKSQISRLEELSEEWVELELSKTEQNTHAIKEIEKRQCLLEESLLEQAETIRDAMKRGSMPDEVTEAVEENYRGLDKNIAVAIRSSATAEDLFTASFAGQYETFLNLKGTEQIIKAVRECWVSLYGNRAVLYRNQQLVQMHKRKKIRRDNLTQSEDIFKQSNVKMGVVIQRMVEANSGGIGFNIDISTGKPGIHIEANYGLGESVVDGRIKPDSWLVNAQATKIDEKKIGNKTKKVVYKAAGGTKYIGISKEGRRKFCMEDKGVLEIAGSIKRIGEFYQRKYGYEAIDVEFVRDTKGDLYFVQVRPITTLRTESVSIVAGKNRHAAEVIAEGGFSASPGVSIGRARVVRNAEDMNKIKDGDILISRDPKMDWVVALQRSGAVVTEEGSVTCHAAIISRENNKPCIVGLSRAIEIFKKYEGNIITVDASSCTIYKGEQLVEQISFEELVTLREQESKKIGLAEERKAEGWMEWPRFPLGNFQRELYWKAFDKLEGIIGGGFRFEKKVVGEKIHVKTSNKHDLIRILKGKTIEELEHILETRKEAVSRFIKICEDFDCTTDEKFREFISIYIEVIAYFHMRGPFQEAIEELYREQVEQLPSGYQNILMSLIMPEQKSEYQESIKSYGKLLEKAKENPSLFEHSELKEVISGLETNTPDLFKEIVNYAEDYAFVDGGDDLRIETPIHQVVGRLRTDVRSKASIREPTFIKKEVPLSLLSKIPPKVLKILNLLNLQGTSKNDEHIIQQRYQRKAKSRILRFAGELTKQGLLEQPEDIFDISIEEFIAYFKRPLDTPVPQPTQLAKKLQTMEDEYDSRRSELFRKAAIENERRIIVPEELIPDNRRDELKSSIAGDVAIASLDRAIQMVTTDSNAAKRTIILTPEMEEKLKARCEAEGLECKAKIVVLEDYQRDNIQTGFIFLGGSVVLARCINAEDYDAATIFYNLLTAGEKKDTQAIMEEITKGRLTVPLERVSDTDYRQLEEETYRFLKAA